MPNWVQGVQVETKHRPNIDGKMKSKMKCILTLILDTFQWILGGKLGGKIDQNWAMDSSRTRLSYPGTQLA